MRIKDLEWSVTNPATNTEHCFSDGTEATEFAVRVGARHLDLLCWSAKAAEAIGLKDEYLEDPEHSVTCRYVLDENGTVVDVLGMIP